MLERCIGNARELQLAALCWGLACAYQTVINTIQHPQGKEEVTESDDQITHTVANPEGQLSTVSVAPIVKAKQWKQSNWQGRGKRIWAAALWQDIAAEWKMLM